MARSAEAVGVGLSTGVSVGNSEAGVDVVGLSTGVTVGNFMVGIDDGTTVGRSVEVGMAGPTELAGALQLVKNPSITRTQTQWLIRVFICLSPQSCETANAIIDGIFASIYRDRLAPGYPAPHVL